MSKVTVVLQARMGSTRLPGKVLAEIAGQPLLQRVIERARRIPGTTEVLLATSVDPANVRLIEMAKTFGISSYAGSESDVLDRCYQAAKRAGADIIVRLTADCPLIDPDVSGRVVNRFFGGGFDYVSNTMPPTYPDGLDTEVFSFAALERAWREASLPSEREHVTPFIWKNPSSFRIDNVASDDDLSHHRWTVDDADDLAFVRTVYSQMTDRGVRDFGMRDVLALLTQQPHLRALNSDKMRNEGYVKSVSEDRPIVPQESH